MRAIPNDYFVLDVTNIIFPIIFSASSRLLSKVLPTKNCVNAFISDVQSNESLSDLVALHFLSGPENGFYRILIFMFFFRTSILIRK